MTLRENQEALISHELNGLTKREYFAIQALNGLTAKYTLNSPEDQHTLAQLSVELAETLLTELNK